ncbi:MAG: ABC transporter ATP-binding protein [Desulfobacterales bacterium]|nr:ABC transporter ATP-binding protein [Desulfobacterales bacterium]
MISLDCVTKKYKSITAVDNVSYGVEKGEFFALLGPNGAGKTTIVRMLMGFSTPTMGMLKIDGISTQHHHARNKVGYLAENHCIPPFLSGWEYLLRSSSLIGVTGKDASVELDSLLDRVDLIKEKKQKASTYSKGMSQRIGLAAALIGKPKLLILDEPASGLDPLGIRDFREILESLRGDGTTIVLNSHFLSEVEKTCDTAAIMNKGKILVKDSIHKIVQKNETLEDVFVRLVDKRNA